eukprot:TRINITY_DN2576_c0_g1_i3.p1 TRINITY_DN2576_c0_g1~~TRINITY_DN2576_c0_g1_i3.p1  ORF type:complete len:388 (-),score=54.68 TRINITY_DN2576_c0_g1_i3:816-1979(-)
MSRPPVPLASPTSLALFFSKLDEMVVQQKQLQQDPSRRETAFRKFLEDLTGLIQTYSARLQTTKDEISAALQVPTEVSPPKAAPPAILPQPIAAPIASNPPPPPASSSQQSAAKKRYSAQGQAAPGTPQSASTQFGYQPYGQQLYQLQRTPTPQAQTPAQPQYYSATGWPQAQQQRPQAPVQAPKPPSMLYGAPTGQSSRSTTPTTHKAEIRVNLSSVQSNIFNPYSPAGMNPPSSRSATGSPAPPATTGVPGQVVLYEEQKKGRESPAAAMDSYTHYQQYMDALRKGQRPTAAGFTTTTDLYSRAPASGRGTSAYSSGHHPPQQQSAPQQQQQQRPTTPQWGQQQAAGGWQVPAANYGAPQSSSMFGSYGSFSGSVPYTAPTMRYY